MEYTKEEYEAYLKVQRYHLKEDAGYFVSEYLADKRGVDPIDDITLEEVEKYDLEYLVKRFEKRADANVAFNDTWRSVVREYMDECEVQNGQNK